MYSATLNVTVYIAVHSIMVLNLFIADVYTEQYWKGNQQNKEYVIFIQAL